MLSDNDMNEIEDVSFLPGAGSSCKKGMYEPDGLQRCRQIVCSPRKATAIVTCFIVIIFIIALIAAFARPRAITHDCVLTTPPPEPVATPTVPIATNGKLFPWSDIRLPNTIIPMSYKLFLHPNLTTFTFNGNVSILLNVTKKTDFIIYHIKELKIISQELALLDANGKDVVRKVSILDYLEYTNHEQLYVKLDKHLQVNSICRLDIKFSGILSDNLAGFYRSSYETSTGEKRWLATTHFEATDARAAFPCFDEPQLKANFTLSMVREPMYISLFNTEKVSEEPFQNGLMLDRFAPSVTMSTYLVAFVVCDFGSEFAYTKKSNIKVSVYAPKEMLNQTLFALDVATRVLDYYEEYYGISYPLNKSDHIAIPDFSAGAMENWGLVTYLMRLLLFNPEESSAADQQWVAVVVAHELAHQWFGNLVTMKWWNDLWLNEGFARFVEYLGTNHVHPEWQMLDLFLDDALSVALYHDGLVSSHPISVPVYDPVEIGEIFDAISYEKGASVIRMLQNIVHEDTFNRGLRKYLIAHQYSNAETDDLWTTMTEEVQNQTVGFNVKSMMDTWTLQMGYPVVTVTRNGDTIRATQERFLYNPRSNQTDEFPSPFGYKWCIPITYAIESQPGVSQPLQWLKEKDDIITFKIDSKSEWIKVNENMTGVYRVHYDLKNWRALIDQLQKNHTVFSPSDRANLIADAFALARSGHLNITVALELSRYLKNETDYVPWQIALSALGYIGDILEGHADYHYFSAYMKELLTNVVKELGWEDTGVHVTSLLRASVLGEALKHGFDDDIRRAQEGFKDWKDKNISISPNLKSVVYIGGVKYGGDDEWKFVWQRFLATQTPSEKSKLLMALSATMDALRLNRFLQLSLDEKYVRSSDTPSMIQSVAANPAGRVLAWRFVRMNWNVFYSRYHNVMMKMKRVILSSAGHFTTQFDYNEVKEFFDKNLQGENLRSVSQALDRIAMNIDWLSRNEAMVIGWLKLQSDRR